MVTIDIDAAGDDRSKIYDYIINRFGKEKTAFILAIGTDSSKGTIDDIGRGLSIRWCNKNLINEKEIKNNIKDAREAGNKPLYDELQLTLENAKKSNEEKKKKDPYSLTIMSKIKREFECSEEDARKKYPEIFYYYDGILGTRVSQSMHPAGIVASPITLYDNYGTFVNDDNIILQIDMEGVHEVSLVKYDILGLKNIKIIKYAYKYLNKPYPLSHEIDWEDEKVWDDMLKSPIGIFQMESDFSFSMLKKFKPKSIYDMSLVTACIRPSGESYRQALMERKINKNPSEIIDELLKNNLGYLVYQEDVIAFLTNICGFSGSDADNIRRAIGRKDEERLNKELPNILEGYCKVSKKERSESEKDALEFIKIISDASSYMFG